MARLIHIPLGAYVHPYQHSRVLGLAVNVYANVIATSHYPTYDLHHVTHIRISSQKTLDGNPVLLAQLFKSARVAEGWIKVARPDAETKRLPRL